MKIKLLDEATIQKIAAGEVIERPSSVIKEMIENSIDAGATAITVEVRDGGKTFLRVTDNGSGIEADDIASAFIRHATSKIENADDLIAIKSLGFRGEALSSISAVAKVEVITKTHSAMTGLRYQIEGGVEVSNTEIGAPDGTTIIVKDLFFNTPVRGRFLKSSQTEGGYVQDVIERIAMSHPDISFTFISSGNTKLHTVGNGNIKDIIYAIYGKDIASRVVEVKGEVDGIKISGYVSKPQIARSNRGYESYYINGRYMKSQVIAKAIDEAYKPYIMGHRFPFTALNIAMDEVMVDVNVHPTKMEVRFANASNVYAAVLTLVGEALSGKNLISEEKLDGTRIIKKPDNISKSTPEPFEKKKLDEIRSFVRETSPYERRYLERDKKSENIPSVENKTESIIEETILIEAPKQVEEDNETTKIVSKIIEEPIESVSEKIDEPIKKVEQPNKYEQLTLDIEPEPDGINPLKNKIKVIGQLFDTYWLIEDMTEQKFYMMDQHAAHEKVNFERLLKQFKERSFYSQQLLVSIIVQLSALEKAALDTNIDEFTNLGFEIDDFGDNTIKISAVPDNIYGIDPKEFFLEVLDDMTSDGRATNDTLWLKIATAACKASIKGGWQINEIEVKALIEELLTLDNPFNCPHGRPTMIAMSKSEIEKRFRRIV